MSAPTDRRTFLKLASASALAATTARATRAVGNSPNDKLTVALVGCGGRGMHDAGLFKEIPNVEIIYVCDCHEGRREAAAKMLGIDSSRAIADMRRLLDDKSLDALVVTTPDHWHSPASILACDAGKHVFVEKPISHNIREGRLLIDSAARNNVKVQHGTQCRSTQMMIDAVKLLRAGIIGNVLAAKSWNVQRRVSIGRGQDTNPPAGLNYEDWVGPAAMIPYRTNRVHINWRWWRNFGTGDMGNDGVHDLDYARWGLGVETHPSKIMALGGKYFFDDDQEFPDTQQVIFEYPGDGKVGSRRLLIYEQRLWNSNYPHNADSGAELYGTDGQMFLSRRGKVQVLDSQNKPKRIEVQPQRHDDLAHVKNFVAAIRDGAPLNADALVGHLSTSLCHLGNIATRLGRSLNFDPEKEQIIGDDEANKLVRREYRDHWGRPKGA
jgi:predicted dehydrogenase